VLILGPKHTPHDLLSPPNYQTMYSANLPSTSMKCPCGRTEHLIKNNKRDSSPRNSGKPISYEDCCARFIEGGAVAPNAGLLMRSRYTAYVLEHKTYLLETWHADERPQDIEFEPGIKWLGLEVQHDLLTGEATAEVEFVARYRVSGKGHRLHERSHFVMINDKWFYTHGEMMG